MNDQKISSPKEVKILDVKTVGKMVQHQRKIMKLSQADLSGVCGVGIRFISELENGKKTVEFSKVLQVLQSLGLELVLKKRDWN